MELDVINGDVVLGGVGPSSLVDTPVERFFAVWPKEEVDDFPAASICKEDELEDAIMEIMSDGYKKNEINVRELYSKNIEFDFNIKLS